MFPLANSRQGVQAGSNANTLQDRAPALRDAVDRLVEAIVAGLQTMAGTTTAIEGSMVSAALEPFGDFIAAHPSDAVAGLVECIDIGSKILLTLDGLLVHSIVELLSGGNGAEPPLGAPRAATAIDHQFSLILVTLAASAIKMEWAELGFGATRAAKIEGPLATDLLGARVADVAVVRMKIGAFGQQGILRLVLPPAALARFRRDDAVTSTSKEDPVWRDLLQREIGRASVQLGAYLDAKPIALSALATLDVGQVLVLPPEARERGALICNGRTYFRGEIGQDDGRYSLRIDEIVADPAALDFSARGRAFADNPGA